MNLKEIRDLVKLMNENDLSEIEIEREGSKIKLKKGTLEQLERSYSAPIHVPVSPNVPAVAVEVPENNSQSQIKSPMVGTFYRSPSPESPSFVEVGQVVDVGQVVCIVEAMKLMNEIKSEVKGKVVEVLVDNAQPVEFGQILFAVEPS